MATNAAIANPRFQVPANGALCPPSSSPETHRCHRQISMRFSSRHVSIALFAALATIPMPASANVGLPMIFITLPWMLVALAPVVLVESMVVTRSLPISFGRATVVTCVGNVLSTLVGMPLTWAALLGLEVWSGGDGAHGLHTPWAKFLAVTWQAAWLLPYEGASHWMIPSAILTLMVPFFFASWFAEYQVGKRMLKRVDAALVRRSILMANLVSYGALAVIVLGWLIAATRSPA